MEIPCPARALDSTRHRICVVGDRVRFARHEHRRSASRLPARSSDLRILVEGRDCGPRSAFRAWRYRQTRRHLAGPDPGGHGCRRRDHSRGCAPVRIVGKAWFAAHHRDLDLRCLGHRGRQGSHPRPQLRRRLCDRGDLGAWGRRIVHIAATWTRDRAHRPRIRLVGRSGGRQHRRDHRHGLPVFRASGKDCGAGEVHTQRSHRFRGTGFRSLLGFARSGRPASHRGCGRGRRSSGRNSPSSSWVSWRCRRSRQQAG